MKVGDLGNTVTGMFTNANNFFLDFVTIQFFLATIFFFPAARIFSYSEKKILGPRKENLAVRKKLNYHKIKNFFWH